MSYACLFAIATAAVSVSLCHCKRGSHHAVFLKHNDNIVSDYVDYQCEEHEWSDFLQKYRLQTDGKGSLKFTLQAFSSHPHCNGRNVLWFWPASDSNDAFKIDNTTCFRLLNWYDHACSVTVRRVATVDAAEAILDEYQENSIMHAVLGGHGTPTALTWGDCAGPDQPIRRTQCHVAVELLNIFENISSSHVRGTLTRGKSVIAAGPPVNVEGWDMLPILGAPGGAVQLDFVKCSDCRLGLTETSMPFLSKLHSKMHRHGSLVMDSCNSAKLNGGNLNLAQHVANVVKKGVRVFGIDDFLYSTDVQQFHSYYPHFNNKDPVVHVVEAKCPSWAPLSDGEEKECACPAEQRCLFNCTAKAGWPIFESVNSGSSRENTQLGQRILPAGQMTWEGGYLMMPIDPSGAVQFNALECHPCPSSRGGTSETRFTPSCSEEWSTYKCRCA